MLKRYFASFLSGFLAPFLGVLIIFLLPYGVFIILIYGPWIILVNFVSLFLLKKYFQEKYSFVAGLVGICIPLLALGLYALIHNNLNAVDPKTTTQSVAQQPVNTVSIQTVKCNDQIASVQKGEKLSCLIYLNNLILDTEIGSYKLKMDQLFDYNKDQNQTLESFIAKCLKASNSENAIICTFESSPTNNTKYMISLAYKSEPGMPIQDIYFNY